MQTPAHQWITSSDHRLQQRWDANQYLHSQERGHWHMLGELVASFQEGERVSAEEAHQRGFFRPSSIQGLRLNHKNLSNFSGDNAQQTVGTGDVVLSKFLPPRAAWVTTSTSRRPIDQNCVRLIGLASHDGFWVAHVLEHPFYQQLLAHRAASSALPRLGLRDLKSLRIPETPPNIRILAEQWNEICERISSTEKALTSLQQEVEDVVVTEAFPLPSQHPQFYPAAHIPDIWIPSYAKLKQFQIQAKERGWESLERYFSAKTARIRESVDTPSRVLRLCDANDTFGFVTPEPAELQQATFRIFALPLQENEVLLSVLGSAPKVVFHFPHTGIPVLVSDQWVRLTSSHPGALALMLNTSPIAWQLRLSTVGNVQQFVPKSELEYVCIPQLPRSVAQQWDQSLRESLVEIQRASRQLHEIQTTVRQWVDQCLGGSHDT